MFYIRCVFIGVLIVFSRAAYPGGYAISKSLSNTGVLYISDVKNNRVFPLVLSLLEDVESYNETPVIKKTVVLRSESEECYRHYVYVETTNKRYTIPIDPEKGLNIQRNGEYWLQKFL